MVEEFKSFRKCGQCTVCCVELEIPVLQKPAKQRCDKLTRTGCSIYADSPSVCKGFQCVWSEKMLPNSARPDKSGIFAYRHDSQWGPALSLVELRSGAFMRNAKNINKLQVLVDRNGWAMIITDSKGQQAAMVPEE
tara:strand:+ start:64749 stop:65156 length:408 start_codon:yes stop_codon:yes gene_type:complete